MLQIKKKFLKVMILGNSGVGKTSLLEQYVTRAFSGAYKVTIGADFLTKDLDIDGSKVKLQIWDTAGQEKYRSLSVAYYRGADACFLVYDITDKTSFKELDKWLDAFTAQLTEDKVKNFPLILLGNKADKKERIVTTEMARKWCTSSGHEDMPFFETSAKTRVGVDEAFEQITRMAIKHSSEEEMYGTGVIC